MIKGVRLWDNEDVYYSQENNPTEAFLKATLNDRDSWLETCGPTAAINCLAAMGVNIEIVCPGIYKPQPEEVLMDFLNDPRNKAALKAVRLVDDTIPENRVPQYYPLAVGRVFRAKAMFVWGLTFMDVAKYVLAGRAVQICLRRPGHYIAVIAYDDAARELIYNDSWGGRFPDGGGGWHRKMAWGEFNKNVQTYFVVYGV
jgi:hypothetical protein